MSHLWQRTRYRQQVETDSEHLFAQATAMGATAMLETRKRENWP